jgi:hypothetical protein
MPPCIDTPLTGITKAGQDFLQGRNLGREEKQQACIFQRSETGLAPSASASLAGCLDAMLGLPVGRVGQGKVRQSLFPRRLLHAGAGTQGTRVVCALWLREHSENLQ